MRVAEAEFGGEAVDGGAAVAKSLFDCAAESEANAVEIAGNAGLVLADLPADLGEGLFFGIVKAETLFIARIESGESGLQGTHKKRGVPFAVRVGGLNGNSLREFLNCLCAGRLCVVFFERFEAAPGADGVNMTLGENGAKPGFERAAPVEVTEKRALATGAVHEAIKLGEKRVSEIAGFRRSRTATEHRGCSGAQVASILADEMLPRGFAIFHAGGRESQVLQMEGREIFLELLWRQGSAGKPFLGAAL